MTPDAPPERNATRRPASASATAPAGPSRTTVVIKYGGNAMTDPTVRRSVAQAIAALALGETTPVVVHGGGPYIKAALEQAGIASEFVRGLRVTTRESLPVVESALTLLGKELAAEIGRAVGLTGRDARLLEARRLEGPYGLVGTVTHVDTVLLRLLQGSGITPVVACIARDDAGDGVLNVNADDVAGAVAGALAAPVVFLSDVPGVLDDARDPGSLLGSLSGDDARARIADGRISGGMIPKVEAALAALERGAPQATIADGRTPDGLAAALEQRGGTVVRS